MNEAVIFMIMLFSGIVKDTEIKKAGEYLGADFVGVARASKPALHNRVSDLKQVMKLKV